jgi:hypothetical protein
MIVEIYARFAWKKVKRVLFFIELTDWFYGLFEDYPPEIDSYRTTSCSEEQARRRNNNIG